jgi:hypothetical protein
MVLLIMLLAINLARLLNVADVDHVPPGVPKECVNGKDPLMGSSRL